MFHTHRHTDTQTHTHTRTHTDTQTHTHTHTRTHAHAHTFWGALELGDDAVKLVEEEHRLDMLGEGLAHNRLRLHTNALDAVNNHNRAVRDAQGTRDLAGKVNVARAVNQVDAEVAVTRDNVAHNMAAHACVCVCVVAGRLGAGAQAEAGRPVWVLEADAGGLDGDAVLLLDSLRVHGAGLASLCVVEHACTRQHRVCQRGLAVVDVRDDAHVACDRAHALLFVKRLEV